MAHHTSDPDRSYGYQSRATHRAFDRLLQQHLRQHGLTNGYWYVLRVLWEREGMTQRELARAAHLTESSAVIMLDGMQRAGFLTRRKDPEDGRRQRVFLTAKAKRLKPKLLPVAGKLNALAARGIDPEDLDTYLAVAQEMRANLIAALETG
ncbi:MAG: MarR family transcriptional regulator [Pseudomonadales bacterium]|nr:MarR family transcriptional regulator [Pseudomonadales bacterium]NIX06749.1 MarR family transcriptional regulator [Pseudomonadales bacterium]